MAGRDLAQLIDDIEQGEATQDVIPAYPLGRIDREERSSKNKTKRSQSADAARAAGVLGACEIKVWDGAASRTRTCSHTTSSKACRRRSSGGTGDKDSER